MWTTFVFLLEQHVVHKALFHYFGRNEILLIGKEECLKETCYCLWFLQRTSLDKHFPRSLHTITSVHWMFICYYYQDSSQATSHGYSSWFVKDISEYQRNPSTKNCAHQNFDTNCVLFKAVLCVTHGLHVVLILQIRVYRMHKDFLPTPTQTPT